MDDNEKNEFLEMDVEMGSEKKTRRSSILKPQKPRNPLSTLDFSESNPDTTLARATRRVSFASSNFVKPFAADPEKNTIWDNTYEEEVNHTDSTKSSCDQTHGTKTSDILNMSSVYSTSQTYQNEKITFGASSLVSESININTEKVQTVNIVSNPRESLISFARTLRSKSFEQSTCEMVVNKNSFRELAVNEVSDKENIKLQQSVFISTSDKTENACATSKIGDTMEITCIVDKENVNPIINDLSLVVPRQNLSCKSVSKDFREHFEDKENDVDFTRLDVKNDFEDFKTTMEFTCIADCNKIRTRDENTNETCAVGTRTIYFDDSMNDMEFTNTYKDVELQNKSMTNQERRKTIIFDQTGGSMDFTLINTGDLNMKQSSVIEKFQFENETKGSVKKPSRLGNKTIHFDALESDMEFTTTLPVKILSNTKTPTAIQSKREETIRFDNSGEEMLLTDVFSTQKIVVEDEKILKCNVEVENNATIAQVDDMEFTAVLPTKTIENVKNYAEENVTTLKQCEINSESDTTQNVSAFKLCDMSLTKNLHVTKNTFTTGPDPVRRINSCVSVQDISMKLLTGVDKMTINPNNSDTMLNVTNNPSYVGKTDKFSPKQNISDHESPESDVLSVSKGVDIKRHITKCPDEEEEIIKKRKIQQTHRDETHTDLKNPLYFASHKTIKTSSAIEGRDSLPVLESNPIEVAPHDDSVLTKLKLKTPNFAAIHDLSGSGLDRVSTPATSFHINLSGMSPCTEDTQQLIHATFSRPETLKVLNTSKFSHSNNASNLERNNMQKSTCEGVDGPTYDDSTKLNGRTFVQDFVSEPDTDFIKIAKQNSSDDKSYFLEDITPLALVPEEFDASDSPNRNHTETGPSEGDSSKSDRNSDAGNYTLRSHMVLCNIEKYLLPYEPLKPQKSLILPRLRKDFKENSRLIKEICGSKEPVLVDLEEVHKRDMEESLSNVNEAVTSTEEEVGTPLAPVFITPRTLRERICEAAERTKKYWELVKTEDDYFYFYTLFGTLPFKVHVHPVLGIVYSVKTYTNLSDVVLTICWYQLKLFQQKLKQENLLSVLGAKFDIFTLLDYVYMSMEEIMNFHSEYMSLVKKYGKSHHFRMNPDYSITFEIMNIKLVICWIITVKMCLSSPFSVTKEDVTAVHKVGQKVNEDHIRTIVENTSKGLNFFRNFLENVDEYVNRIGRRIKK